MTAPHEERAKWTIQEAERLLLSLQGVVSARIVARPGGVVEEIHLLTSTDVKPKQTVRNVESALLAHLDLSVDHRKISVAQTQDAVTELPAAEIPIHILPGREPYDSRVLFYGHHMETERSNTVKHRVEIEWRGERYVGEASAADMPRPKLEAVTSATLRAIEKAVIENLDDDRQHPTLSLDGVKVVDAFDKKFVVVALHAISGRDTSRLSGTNIADESTDRAAILATLQATDRWVRGNFYP
ncbi:MAG: hypothetical protein OEO79_08470 [Gemmatimonadota bacterium]|nr:hypothetical protein [Gemmatimonadota bacterium]MDH3421669.1 hypothetical protein [Gemmatimonadota bacterium]